MKTYLVSDIVRDAKVAMDRNTSSEQLAGWGDVDTLTLEEILSSKVEEAAREVESVAPRTMLDGEQLGDNVAWLDAVSTERGGSVELGDEMSLARTAGVGAGRIVLPADFMRLLVFRMSDWDRAVYDAIGSDDPRYALQSSRYGGIRGNPQKPVVAIVNYGDGLALEFYSCKGGQGVKVSEARYVPIPKITDGKIKISEKVYTAVVYHVAYLAALTLGDTAMAQAMMAVVNTYIGGNNERAND